MDEERVRDRTFVRRAVEAAIRIGLVVLLVAWCYDIVRPFVIPFVWGLIIAVAVYPGYRPLESFLGGRRALAATLVSLLLLVILIGPTVMLAGTLVEGAQRVAQELMEGTPALPPPPPGIAEWPLIGAPLAKFWTLAADDLGRALAQIRPQIAAGGRLLLSVAANVGLGIVQFVIAIIIAGVLLAQAHRGDGVANAIALRLAGERGPAYADLMQATIRSVARGILGVALIQSLLAGLGFLAVGLPGAGLLAVLCLLLAVVQIGPFVVLAGAVVYVFTTASTATAIAFTAWCLFVGLIDNILKPLLLGRGVEVPMLVVLVGAIGGLLATGIIGLFIGSVVLALGYTLFRAWLQDTPAPAAR
ncbi:MAG TPA: AI-2E family transporter [Rhodospirillales bacterium]|nr:AI-2E family transporter [Rhodospirillales bacterium]